MKYCFYIILCSCVLSSCQAEEEYHFPEEFQIDEEKTKDGITMVYEDEINGTCFCVWEKSERKDGKLFSYSVSYNDNANYDSTVSIDYELTERYKYTSVNNKEVTGKAVYFSSEEGKHLKNYHYLISYPGNKYEYSSMKTTFEINPQTNKIKLFWAGHTINFFNGKHSTFDLDGYDIYEEGIGLTGAVSNNESGQPNAHYKLLKVYRNSPVRIKNPCKNSGFY